MGDTKVQGSAMADGIIPGVYSVYIDQDDNPDGFTVRNGNSEPVDRSDRGRDNFALNLPGYSTIHTEGKYQLSPNFSLGGKWFEDSTRNSFELASGKPLDENSFKNGAGEELKLGSIIEIQDNTSDKIEVGLRAHFSLDATSTNNSKWKISGFKIAGFTDDPERKRTDNMSKIPDEKRKYAVIDVELVSTDRVTSYKKDYLKCAPDGTCGTTPVYETRTVALDSLGKNKDIMKKEDRSGDGFFTPTEHKFGITITSPWKF